MSDLKDKVALITGSSRGIGAAIVRLFASRGAKVAIHGRDTNAIDAVYTDIERQGGIATKVVADVTKFDQIQAMRQQVERAFGPIDILVTSAGGSFTPSGPLENVTEEGWRAAVEGNLTATFLTIESVLPSMKARNTGSIITISSAAGRKPHPQAPIPYSAAKAGIQVLTQDVAAQVGPYGIRVNCIAPETILTQGNRQRIPETQIRPLIDIHPIKLTGNSRRGSTKYRPHHPLILNEVADTRGNWMSR